MDLIIVCADRVDVSTDVIFVELNPTIVNPCPIKWLAEFYSISLESIPHKTKKKTKN